MGANNWQHVSGNTAKKDILTAKEWQQRQIHMMPWWTSVTDSKTPTYLINNEAVILRLIDSSSICLEELRKKCEYLCYDS